MACHRRLIRECEKYNIEMNDIITVGSFTIHIPPLYPFAAPELKRYGKNIIVQLSKRYIDLLPFIKKYNLKIECICCSTISCIWSPCNTIMDLVDEATSYMNKLYCIQICQLLFPKLPFDDNIQSSIVQYLL